MEVQVKKLSSSTPSNICILPENVFDAFNLNTERLYNFHFGVLAKTSLITFSAANEKVMYFPDDMFDKLKLLEEIKGNVAY